MEVLQTIAVTLLTLGILVTFHEFGHFWVARRCGVRVLRFSIGFGKPIWQRVGKDGTEYVVALVPLGGYVKMLGEQDDGFSEQDAAYAFSRKAVWQRFSIVAAGPLANFGLAILAFWFVFMLGITEVSPLLGKVRPESPAAQAGLAAHQEITHVDGEPVRSWQEVNMQLLSRIGDTGVIDLTAIAQGSDVPQHYQLPIRQWLSDAQDPDLLGSLGLEMYQPRIELVLSEVMADSAAARAGMVVGDRLLSADGVAVTDWEQWVGIVRGAPDKTLQIGVERQGQPLTLTLIPDRHVAEDGKPFGLAGVKPVIHDYPPEMIREVSYSPWGAVVPALRETGRLCVVTLDSLKKLVTGAISPKNLSGPITIAKVANSSVKHGLVAYLGLLALLSVNLGLFNLLPIPVLDGGHLVFYTIEGLKGSPVSEKIQTLAYQIGLSIVLGVMMLAVYNDIVRF